MTLPINTEKILDLLEMAENLPSQRENVYQTKTTTPTKTTQTIIPDRDYDALSKVTVNAIPDEYIVPSGNLNITDNGNYNVNALKTVNVNVQGLDTSDATATNSDILLNKTAYVNGVKVTGTIQSKGSQTYTPGSSAQTISAGVYLTGTQTISAVPTETKSATPTKSIQTVVPTTGKYLSSVTVNKIPDQYIVPSGELDITTNGQHTVTSYETVNVNVDGGIDTSDATATATDILATKTAYVNGEKITGSITSKAAQTYTPNGNTQTISAGVYLSGAQTINPVPTETKTVAPALTDQTVTPTSGKYLTSVKVTAMPLASREEMSINVDSNGLISTDVVTIESGYISARTVTVTKQLTTKGATTITPKTTSQTAVGAGTYVTGNIIVGTIPTQYIITTDATATATDIASGKTAYVNGSKVIGTVVMQRYYTGATTPSSTLGNDGDIYLMT